MIIMGLKYYFILYVFVDFVLFNFDFIKFFFFFNQKLVDGVNDLDL